MGLSPFKRCIQNLRYAAILSGLVANVNCFFPRLSGGRLCFSQGGRYHVEVSWVPRVPPNHQSHLIMTWYWNPWWLGDPTGSHGIPDFELRKPHLMGASCTTGLTSQTYHPRLHAMPCAKMYQDMTIRLQSHECCLGYPSLEMPWISHFFQELLRQCPGSTHCKEINLSGWVSSEAVLSSNRWAKCKIFTVAENLEKSE